MDIFNGWLNVWQNPKLHDKGVKVEPRPLKLCEGHKVQDSTEDTCSADNCDHCKALAEIERLDALSPECWKCNNTGLFDTNTDWHCQCAKGQFLERKGK